MKPGLVAKLRATAGFLRVVRNWPLHYAATYDPRRPPSFVYRLRNGLEIEGRPRTLDVAVLKDVFFHEIYTPPGFEVEDGAVVVDIGAHIGAFAAYAARAAQGVTVLAFEPSPENFALAERNVARNRLANVRLSPEAVAGARGARDLFISQNLAAHSLHRAIAPRGTVSVTTATLGDILSRHSLVAIDLLKMDCEGAEYEILESAAGETLRAVRRIALEAHHLDGERTPPRLVAFLEANGFAVRTLAGEHGTVMIWARR